MINCLLDLGIKLLDNTFFGTLFAGIILAYVGRYLYVNQKKVDSEYASQQKIKELSTEILTILNVNVIDFCNQIDVISGVNTVGKVIKDRMEELSPGDFIKQLAAKYVNAVNEITDLFNKLATRLSLNDEHYLNLNIIKERLPKVTIYLTMTSALTKVSVDTLEEIKTSVNADYVVIKNVLENIIK